MSEYTQDSVESERQSTGTKIFSGQLFRTKNRQVEFSDEPKAEYRGPVRRPARVARMLALAHKMQEMIGSGEVPDRTTMARRLGLSRARVTQLLDMLLLAPDIQEEILALEAVDGAQLVTERALRKVVHNVDWCKQRERWKLVSDTQIIPLEKQPL